MSNNDTLSHNPDPGQPDSSGGRDPAGDAGRPDSIADNAGHAHDEHGHGHHHEHGHEHEEHGHDHEDHDHAHGEHGHHHTDEENDRQQEGNGQRERRRKEPSENPANLSEQLVAGTLRGRRSKCSHGCGSDGGCSTGGCGVGSLVEMIANKFDYSDTRQIVEVTYAGYRRGFAAIEEEETPLRVRDVVVVRSPNGTDWGSVSMTGSLVHAKRKAKRLSNEELPKLLRKANEADLKRIEQCKVSERHAFSVCRTRIESFNLPMLLVGSEWQFDHKKLTFFFTADGRVDFRELVRDLAAIFNTRIELRQIPVRDAAKRIGGMGVCGLELCCTTHLGRYEHVTLDHAKIQQIPANPSKLSGQCGRLKCCLLYEVDTYVEGLKRFPPLESTIETEAGTGVVQKIDLFRDLISLYYAATSTWETLTLEEYRDIVAGRRRKKEPEQGPEQAPPKPREERPQAKGERKDDRKGNASGGNAKDEGDRRQQKQGQKKREQGERRPNEAGRGKSDPQARGSKPEQESRQTIAPQDTSGEEGQQKRRRRKKRGGKKGAPSQGQQQQGQPQQQKTGDA